MVDVFDEVDEQLRAERFRALVHRTIPYFIGALVACVAVVVGVWAYGKFSAAAMGKASLAYSRGLDLEQKGDANGAFAQFVDAAKGPAGYRTLALMQQAGVRLQQGKAADAVALFDQAAKAAPDKMLGDIASLKAAYILLDTASLTDITARLTPLIAADRPYHAQAREALALAKIAAGQLTQARSDLGVIQLLSDTPQSERERAGAIIALIDSGTASSLKAMAAAPALPPPPAPPQNLGVQHSPAADIGN